MGVSVIPCNGKAGLFNAAVVFRAFNTPMFCVWDSDSHLGETAGNCKECGKSRDKKGNPAENRRLLRVFGKEEEDWPGCIQDEFACFATNLENTLQTEIGEEPFDRFLDAAQDAFGILKRDHAKKNPMALEFTFGQAKAADKSSKSIDLILEKISSMYKKATLNTVDEPTTDIGINDVGLKDPEEQQWKLT